MYVKNKGKEVNSTSLVASGADAFNDAILSNMIRKESYMDERFKECRF